MINLLSSGNGRPLHESVLRQLVAKARVAFLNEPTVFVLEPPIAICGDLRGQLKDLLMWFKKVGAVPDTQWLFMGGYVDPKAKGVDVLALLFALKLRYPSQIWLLRGIHESREVSKRAGFFAEVAGRYNEAMWEEFVKAFEAMPLAAVVGERIFCVHGGLAPGLRAPGDLSVVRRPCDVEGMVADILSAEVSSRVQGFIVAERGPVFGDDVVKEFLAANGLDLIIRGHDEVATGAGFPFGSEQTVLTLFSGPSGGSGVEEGRGCAGAVAVVSGSMRVEFEFLAPPVPKRRWRRERVRPFA